MKQKELLTTIGISVLSSVVVFFVLSQIFGQPLFGPALKKEDNQIIVNAHQCTADEVCEVKTRIESARGFPIILSSDSGFAKIESDLILTKQGQSGGVIFKTNNLGSLTITPQSGTAKLEGELTITSLESQIGTILRQNPGGSFTIQTPKGQQVKIDGSLLVTDLGGNVTQKSYVCVDGNGRLYRSNLPCV